MLNSVVRFTVRQRPLQSLIFALAALCASHDAAALAAAEGGFSPDRETARGYVVVVCPPSFLDSLEPWLAHRRDQGYVVDVVNNGGSAEAVRERIQQAFAARRIAPGTKPSDQSGGMPLLADQVLTDQDEAETTASGDGGAPPHIEGLLAPRFVLLVGDAPESNKAEPAAVSTATFFRDAKINLLLGGRETDIATDNPYADWDGDDLPDAAVGRLPADSAKELSQIVEKILAYEQRVDPGVWQRKVNIIAGLGGFGFLADRAIELGARKFITEGIPAAFHTSMTYANWRSPYYPGGRNFVQAAVDRFSEGSLFCVYIGHGSRTSLDYIREEYPLGERYFRILEQRDVDRLACEGGAPIALFLACYTGAFDGPRDSLAEDLLRREGGPVAAVCGSRVTMPYAMSVMGSEMIHECFVNRRGTLGELLLHAKRNMVEKPREDQESRMLDTLASLLNIHNDLPAERREHVSLFNLIGDPVLQLRMPEKWDVAASATAIPGDVLQISGNATFDADVQFELVVRRDRLTIDPPTRDSLFGGRDESQALWDTYQKANEQTLSAAKTLVTAGKEFRVKLRVPEHASGHCHVRIFAVGKDRAAVGSVDVEIK